MAIFHTITIKENTNILFEEEIGYDIIFNKRFYKNLNIDEKIDWDDLSLKDTQIDYKKFINEYYFFINNQLHEQQFDNMYSYTSLMNRILKYTKNNKGDELKDNLKLFISMYDNDNPYSYPISYYNSDDAFIKN